MHTTLGSALDERGNALNLIRLVLASAVVVGHATPLGGFSPNVLTDISSIAVNGFFVLSGFLIAGSRMRNGLGRYLWHRTLRIMPAFWVSLVVVAVVIAPTAAIVSGETWQLSSALTYVTANLTLDISQWGIADTLQHVPFAGAWNGSLWTLQFEFLAYVAAGLLLTSRLVRRHLRLVLCLVTVLTAGAIALTAGPLARGLLLRVQLATARRELRSRDDACGRSATRCPAQPLSPRSRARPVSFCTSRAPR